MKVRSFDLSRLPMPIKPMRLTEYNFFFCTKVIFILNSKVLYVYIYRNVFYTRIKNNKFLQNKQRRKLYLPQKFSFHLNVKEKNI